MTEAPEPAKGLSVGDVVRRDGVGPNMAVYALASVAGEPIARCCWFEGVELQRHDFGQFELAIVPGWEIGPDAIRVVIEDDDQGAADPTEARELFRAEIERLWPKGDEKRHAIPIEHLGESLPIDHGDRLRAAGLDLAYSGETLPIDHVDGLREARLELAKAERELLEIRRKPVEQQEGEQGAQDTTITELLVAKEEVAGQRLRLAGAEELEGANFDGSRVRSFWRAIAELLVEYDHQKAGGLNPRYPANAVKRLAKVAERIATGSLPVIVSEAPTNAGRPLWPDERPHIAMAIFYLRADRQKVPDNNPAKTVAACYEVSQRTVYRWMVRADEICSGILPPSPGVIEKRMRESGAIYSRIGRGTGGDR